VMEAESMLGAKGFRALALEEALSIINRRVWTRTVEYVHGI
jgi:hypothetical protein